VCQHAACKTGSSYSRRISGAGSACGNPSSHPSNSTKGLTRTESIDITHDSLSWSTDWFLMEDLLYPISCISINSTHIIEKQIIIILNRRGAVYLGTHCNIGLKRLCCTTVPLHVTLNHEGQAYHPVCPVGMHRRTDTQTPVITIHFTSAATHANFNEE